VDMGELKADLPGPVVVMPLRHADNKWRLLLNDDLGWLVDFMGIFHRDLGPRIKRPEPPARATPAPPPPPRPERVAARPDPAEVVQVAFAAFERRDWKALAALVHGDRLASFQRHQIAYLTAWTQSSEARAQAKGKGGSSFAMIYDDDSFPPEAIAKVAGVRIAAFSPPQTIGDLAALSPPAFFEAWCQAAYGRMTRGVGSVKAGLQRRVLGQVFEDDSLAHVVYRTEWKYAVETMPLKWSEQRWQLLLNDDIGWVGDLDFQLDPP
jgi:hypothetical protein